ncbi:MAG TPA: hypothetical protein VGL70_04025 [Candidatus Binatia bacterium]|jgi:hypothetical protein
MDSSTLLGIVGVAATIILGGWTLYLALARRYFGRISFVKEECIGLFDEIAKNLPGLSIRYLNQKPSGQRAS